jgi:hypothetical protein
MITIAEHCINRMMIERELLTIPVFVIRVRPEQNRPTIKYLDNSGNRTTRAAIADFYGVSNKCVNDWHNKSGLDWRLTHEALESKYIVSQ